MDSIVSQTDNNSASVCSVINDFVQTTSAPKSIDCQHMNSTGIESSTYGSNQTHLQEYNNICTETYCITKNVESDNRLNDMFINNNNYYYL